jgi:SAM-dependent methyltransferase
VVPNKVYQGAAAGCAVVTSGTRPQRAALGDTAVFVPPGNAAALADALRMLAVDAAELARLRAAARERAGERFAPAAVVAGLRSRLAGSTAARPSTTAAASALPPLAPRAWLRWDLVSRLVDELRPRTVLEIGCGQGSMGARLARRADYLAVEPDPASYEVARARIGACGGTVLAADHTGVPTGSTYDLVCAFEVLEHLADDDAALADWVPLVRPGGHLVISVPAFQRRFGPMDTRVGHYRRYEPEDLARQLVKAGLTDPRVQVYGWPLGYALELVRNRLDARQLAAEDGTSYEERTAASGRHQQPGRAAVGRAIEVATLPFRRLQRLAPTRGTGLVVVATRPDH